MQEVYYETIRQSFPGETRPLGYGIRGAIMENSTMVHAVELKDISTDPYFVAELVQKFNQGALSLLHFEDVVEDFLV